MAATVAWSFNVASAWTPVDVRNITPRFAPSRIFSATAPFAMLNTKSAIGHLTRCADLDLPRLTGCQRGDCLPLAQQDKSLSELVAVGPDLLCHLVPLAEQFVVPAVQLV